MKFTGKNLALVYEALGLAAAELHNQIATCPDVYEYADHLVELEEQHAEIEKLRVSVGRNLGYTS